MDDLEHLQAMLTFDADWRFGQFFFGAVGAATPRGAIVHPFMRIVIVRSGLRCIRLPLNREDCNVTMRPGDVQVSDRHSWEWSPGETPHEVICIVPRDAYLRIASHAYVRDESNRLIDQRRFVHLPHAETESLRHLFAALRACVRESHQQASAHVLEALLLLVRAACRHARDNPDAAAAGGVRLLQTMHEWLDDHFQQPVGRAEIAEAFGVAPGYVSRLFRQHADTTLMDYLTDLRLRFALRLLAETQLKVHQVAEQCGFRDPIYFVRCFRNHIGLPPGRYRNQGRTDRAPRASSTFASLKPQRRKGPTE